MLPGICDIVPVRGEELKGRDSDRVPDMVGAGGINSDRQLYLLDRRTG